MKRNARDVLNRTRSLACRLVPIVLLFALGLGGCGTHSALQKSFGDQTLWPEQPPGGQVEERFRAQVKVRSNLAESHMKLGLFYQKSGRHDLAAKEFARAIRLNGKYVEALNGMGISLTSLGNCAEAATAFETALEVTEEPYLYNNFGCSSLICHDPAQAVPLFRRASELAGDNSRIANNLRLAELRSSLTATKTPVSVSPSPPVPPPAGPVAENHILEQETAAAPVNEAAGRSEPPPAPPPRKSDIPLLAASETKRIRIPRASSDIPIGTIDPGWTIEVSNGNGMTGMAGRSAAFFRKQGFAVGRVTNADRYTVADTVIYYREGYLDAAKVVASIIPGEQQFLQVSDLGRKGIRIRVLLGRDMAARRFPETNENISNETEARRVIVAAAPKVIR